MQPIVEVEFVRRGIDYICEPSKPFYLKGSHFIRCPASTIADERLVLTEVLLCEAVCIIICNKHASGNTRPSMEDDKPETIERSSGDY